MVRFSDEQEWQQQFNEKFYSDKKKVVNQQICVGILSHALTLILVNSSKENSDFLFSKT